MKKQLLSTFFFLLILKFSINTDKIPKIEVFIESHCPSCRHFMTSSFADFVKKFPQSEKIANISIVPYGNTIEKAKKKGKYQFQCQHGKPECYANTLMNCAVKNLEYNKALKFLALFEKGLNKYNNDISKALDNCELSLNWRNYLLLCAGNSEGNSLVHEAAIKTPANHKYVPWILVNGKHDPEIEDKILTDISEYLCGLNNNLIDGCEKYKKIKKNKSFLQIGIGNYKHNKHDFCENENYLIE